MAGVRLRRQTNPDLFRRLTKHFGTDLAQLPVLVRQFETYERANLHLAIEEALADQSSKLICVIVPEHYHSVTLARLSKKQSASNYAEGPVEFMDVALAGDQSLSCVKRSFYLFEHGERPLAMLLYEEQYTQTPGIEVEVMAPGKKEAEDFIARLTRLTKYGKALRVRFSPWNPASTGDCPLDTTGFLRSPGNRLFFRSRCLTGLIDTPLVLAGRRFAWSPRGDT